METLDDVIKAFERFRDEVNQEFEDIKETLEEIRYLTRNMGDS